MVNSPKRPSFKMILSSWNFKFASHLWIRWSAFTIKFWVCLRIDCYFRAHMEYKRTDGGLKIPWSALIFNFQTDVWAFILHMRTKIAINPYIYIFSIILIIKTNILTICKGYMVCHKGTTRGINPASGTANTRPLKDWGFLRKRNRFNRIRWCCHFKKLIDGLHTHTHTNVLNCFWNYCLKFIRCYNYFKIFCALAKVHHSRCNETIGFKQWCHLWNLFLAIWQ